jgi:flagellar basal body rod protein FlgG
MNGLYLAASGAAFQAAVLEVKAHNLANASTPGFRRLEIVAQSASAAGSPYQYAAPPRAEPAGGPGMLERTANPLDVAIVGDGYLAVATDNGEAYTRDGRLAVASDGTLLNASGMPLLNPDGDPLAVPPGTLLIDGDGAVTVNGVFQGHLKLADATDANLELIGSGLYQNADGSPLPAEEPVVSSLQQGYLEKSAASPVTGMVELVNVMRSYESAMHAVSTIDQTTQQAIQAFTFQA